MSTFKTYCFWGSLHNIVTARDEWVYDNDQNTLINKVNFLIDAYNTELINQTNKDNSIALKDSINYNIKWSRAVKNDLAKGKKYSFDKASIIESLYRPYVKKKLYFSRELNEMRYQMPQIFNDGKKENFLIGFLQGERQPFSLFSSKIICNYAMFSADYAQCLPLYQYDSAGNPIENITDWGFNQFLKQYGKKGITKEAIFYYVYAVLHNPVYRKKYELNLKREFPRIPFYKDFAKWSNWGKKLMDMHINYETVSPFKLKEIITDTKEEPKTKLKADKENGTIIIDENTTLSAIPKQAWEYKLGNRSALEWILDQYKESKPKDPTIAEHFNTYKFSDYKEQVIDLLKRVCTVSVETMKLIKEMEAEQN